MTDFSTLLEPDQGQRSRAVHLVDEAEFEAWLKTRSAEDRSIVAAHRFEAKAAGSMVLLPRGGDFEIVYAVHATNELGPWCLSKLAESVPPGTYKLDRSEPGAAALGWLLSQHRFETYHSGASETDAGPRILLTGQAADIEATIKLAEATALVRDLVNTPAGDLGPAELEQVARRLSTDLGATLRVTHGDDLASGYPLIFAVGKAATAERAPRLIELEWGRTDDPRVAIVGKGVCFDSGGLDLKTASGMRLMKKDMGGAAHALALASLVIGAKLPVRLHLLIPAVENAVSGAAFRPGDIIRSRQGLFVEIDNTDAEGRLILADALTRAVEESPQLIIDFATLTGAARVALGPDLPAFFANSDGFAADAAGCARATDDPIWRMPFWPAYDDMLKSDLADLANAANSPMAGCIVAAMFLKRFVPDTITWAHLDTYAWRDSGKPGRPKGGEALGLRAMFALLQKRYLQS